MLTFTLSEEELKESLAMSIIKFNKVIEAIKPSKITCYGENLTYLIGELNRPAEWEHLFDDAIIEIKPKIEDGLDKIVIE